LTAAVEKDFSAQAMNVRPYFIDVGEAKIVGVFPYACLVDIERLA
jgi:hypothetical protein